MAGEQHEFEPVFDFVDAILNCDTSHPPPTPKSYFEIFDAYTANAIFCKKNSAIGSPKDQEPLLKTKL
jgi:hypothetical protein